MILLLALISTIAHAQECVVLLHGMARSESSMNTLAGELEKAGYTVVNYGYPSTKLGIEELAKIHLPKAVKQCESLNKINFVTHSLGGIVLRSYLQKNTIENIGRVVMLGPPNKGSEVVDKLKHLPAFEWINGPAGMRLGTGKDSIPNSLGPVNFPLGVIAGSRSVNPILSQTLPNPDDGKVSVERTKVEGTTDHITLPVTHTFMMKNKEVIKQVSAFLKTGEFERADPSKQKN